MLKTISDYFKRKALNSAKVVGTTVATTVSDGVEYVKNKVVPGAEEIGLLKKALEEERLKKENYFFLMIILLIINLVLLIYLFLQ